MKRRELLKTGLVAGAAGVVGLPLTGCAGVAAAAGNGTPPGAANGNGRRRRPVRNIIFFAYDGFNYEDLALARYYAGRNGLGSLHIERLMGAGSVGSMLTHSLNSVVTDSAAASSAWATGRKVASGALSMYPDGRPLTTILELARQAGKATGLITTTRLTHATPAGWIARVHHRDLEDEIARQYLDFQPDVLLGGGRRHFIPDRDDGRDLEDEFRRAGYTVVQNTAGLRGASGDRLFGSFTDDHLPYEIDRRFQGVDAPSLAEITAAGLAVLDRHPDGFVVQIEAGRIDHANHGNDPGASLWDILAADEALALVLDYVDQNPDTLLLMASDHATGGQVVFGTGPLYARSSQGLDLLEGRKASYEFVRAALPRRPSPIQVRDAVADYLGISLTGPHAEETARVLSRELRLGHPDAHRDQPGNGFYQAISRTSDGELNRPNIHFATGAHTAGLVPVAVYGAWDGPVNLGVVDNTDLFGWMVAALGADFRNPELTTADALRLGDAVGAAAASVL